VKATGVDSGICTCDCVRTKVASTELLRNGHCRSCGNAVRISGDPLQNTPRVPNIMPRQGYAPKPGNGGLLRELLLKYVGVTDRMAAYLSALALLLVDSFRLFTIA